MNYRRLTQPLTAMLLGLALSAPAALAVGEQDHASAHHRAGPVLPTVDREAHRDGADPHVGGHEGHDDHDDHAGREAQAGHDHNDGHEGGEGHEGHDHARSQDGHEAHQKHEGHEAHDDHRGQEDHEGHEAHDDHEGRDDDGGDEGHEGHEQDPHDHTGHASHSHGEPGGAGQTDDHDDHDGHGHDEAAAVELTAAQMTMAGIRVEALRPMPVAAEVAAPGEVALNVYRTSQVTPRIQAQVIARKARLGDRVEAGQPLVTLSSVALAEAQGQLIVAAREWRRVERLGRKVIAEQRYIEARVAWQQARSRLLAYGLDTAEVERLSAKGGDSAAHSADGRFDLVAPQAGTVIEDDFITGQMVEPGRVLFVVTDESRLWVEARANPLQGRGIRVGAAARIGVDGDWLDGEVVQLHHALDESTRTLGVRLAVPNPADQLHPGQFVEARIQLDSQGEARLSLPTAAVLRGADGDWQVFVEQRPGQFEAKEVEVVRQLAGRVVIDGLAAGTRVVIAGAFFVQSELAKGGFDPHNH